MKNTPGDVVVHGVNDLIQLLFIFLQLGIILSSDLLCITLHFLVLFLNLSIHIHLHILMVQKSGLSLFIYLNSFRIVHEVDLVLDSELLFDHMSINV